MVGDFDHDGHADALLTGNSYAPEVLTGRYDAFSGLLLKGDGQGNFQPQHSAETGFYVPEDAKGLATLMLPQTQRLVLAGRNNHSLKYYQPDFTPNLIFRPNPQDAVLEFHHPDGRITRQEIYYGEGYLSQSSRTIPLLPGFGKLVIWDFQGRRRVLGD
ncbi:MAG: hypothetical protein HC880_10490 [Bacteroidia bacterium]|nr:hypothetical protein [Bacteroidia bacterium]